MVSWRAHTFDLQQIWSWLEENWGLRGVKDSNTGTSWSLVLAYVSPCLKKLSLYHIPQVSPVVFLNSGFCPKWKETFCYPSVAIVLAFLEQVNLWRPLGVRCAGMNFCYWITAIIKSYCCEPPVQIRSHAQKYFLKVQKNGTGEHVPPPRPKRKSAQPYPQKAPKCGKTSDIHSNHCLHLCD